MRNTYFDGESGALRVLLPDENLQASRQAKRTHTLEQRLHWVEERLGPVQYCTDHTRMCAALIAVLFVFGFQHHSHASPTSKNGTHGGHAGCHHNYAVLTWDKRKVYLCQQHLCCDSRLQLLDDGSATTKNGVPRWDNATEQLYFFIYNKVEG